MRTVFLNMTMSGVKCIDKPITIQFANKNVDKSIFKGSFVKAIYGTNGEGKTAIVHGVRLYHSSLIDSTYLICQSKNNYFSELINFKTKSFNFDLYFAGIYDENDTKICIFHHELRYAFKDKIFVIESERFSKVNGNTWGNKDNESIIYETKNGEIINLNENFNLTIRNEIIDKTKNKLEEKSPLIEMALICINKRGLKKIISDQYDIEDYVIRGALGISGVVTYLDDKDSHTINKSEIDNFIQVANDQNNTVFVIDKEADEILKNDKDLYKAQIVKITNFLKIFKPELKDISIDFQPYGNKLMCKKILVYKDGSKVSSEYESNGIKKLMKLYACLNAAENGDVVFIDEIDSNIHDVYLCKLIEYFANYSNCQLVFTTHNLGPMEVLSDTNLKHTIDFINHSEITSWKKNGNYSVVNVYRAGLIPNSPFNIDCYDFVKVFGGDE